MTWMCAYCGRLNEDERKDCWYCGGPKRKGKKWEAKWVPDKDQIRRILM